MRSRLLLRRLRSGSFSNVSLGDAMRLAEDLGFRTLRQTGSHHILGLPGVPELVNRQEVGGTAKPYQLRQLQRLIDKYDLQLED